MAKFNQFKFNEELFGPGSSGGSTSAPRERISWTFFDGAASYSLPVNPDSATMPVAKKKVTSKPTCSGRQVLIEGKPEAPILEFSGVILTEAQLREFHSWFQKRKQIRITDDLGNKYWVYLKSFTPARNRSSRVWYHTYSASAVLLDRG